MEKKLFVFISIYLFSFIANTFEAESHIDTKLPSHNETATYSPDFLQNATHHEEEEEHHEEEGEHHEEHSGHYIIWPSAIGMMLFISLFGYLFYKYYSRAQMKKFLKKHSSSFYKDTVLASTLAGTAAPGLIGYHDEKNQMNVIQKETKKLNHFSVL